jgi:hypothetical protein
MENVLDRCGLDEVHDTMPWRFQATPGYDLPSARLMQHLLGYLRSSGCQPDTQSAWSGPATVAGLTGHVGLTFRGRWHSGQVDYQQPAILEALECDLHEALEAQIHLEVEYFGKIADMTMSSFIVSPERSS